MIISNKRNDGLQQINVTDSMENEAELWKRLQKSIALNNVKETNQTLAKWLEQLTGQPIQSINQCFIAMNATECVAQYNSMMQSTYGSTQATWQHTAFISALASLRQAVTQRQQESQHQFSLYPKT